MSKLRRNTFHRVTYFSPAQGDLKAAENRFTTASHQRRSKTIESNRDHRRPLARRAIAAAIRRARVSPTLGATIAAELRARLRLADRIRSMQRELIQQATTDYLTGLLNRRAFFGSAVEACNLAKSGSVLSAVVFDVDRFKCINDPHGHDIGDIVLTKIAEQARKAEGITVATRWRGVLRS